jgi:hypothetical protein
MFVVVVIAACSPFADPSTALILTNDCPRSFSFTIVSSDTAPDSADVARTGLFSIDAGDSLTVSTAPGAHSTFVVVVNSDETIAWTSSVDIPTEAPWPEVKVADEACPD